MSLQEDAAIMAKADALSRVPPLLPPMSTPEEQVAARQKLEAESYDDLMRDPRRAHWAMTTFPDVFASKREQWLAAQRTRKGR